MDFERGALPGSAEDGDPAPVSFHDHLALKHTNAQARFFGGLERAEQRFFDEFGRHAAPGVADAQHAPLLTFSGGNGNLALAVGHGFRRVEQEVGDHFSDLVLIDDNRRDGLQLLDHLNRGGLELGNGLLNELV